MSALEFARPASLAQALALHAPGGPAGDGSMWLAGGQSLLAAMKLGMASPARLIDLQDLPGLREIGEQDQSLSIGAMATHAAVAASDQVKRWAPGLALLAGGIADEQVRQMGTLGGSLAHNDPAACWPAGVLAAGATLVTDQRQIAAADYFQGLYTTALRPGELILGVRFPRLQGLRYLKFEQPASRFALVGVAVARALDGSVRVAVTGLGLGVVRWPRAEQALSCDFSLQALQGLVTDDLQALADLHASADYRRHLASVLAARCVSALGGGRLPQHAPLAPRQRPALVAQHCAETMPEDGFGDVQVLAAAPAQVWQTLLDAGALRDSIPGCESLVQTRADAYEATVKVGLGPLSVRFKSEVLLSDLLPPQSLTLVLRASAGTMGSGQGQARVRLEPLHGQTRLHWWVQVQLSGRLAQFGNRLVEATARKLAGEFFERMGQALSSGQASPSLQTAPWWRRLIRFFFPSSGK
jgi:carbon-monoxide dehydrogenase medium subunit